MQKKLLIVVPVLDGVGDLIHFQKICTIIHKKYPDLLLYGVISLPGGNKAAVRRYFSWKENHAEILTFFGEDHERLCVCIDTNYRNIPNLVAYNKLTTLTSQKDIRNKSNLVIALANNNLKQIAILTEQDKEFAAEDNTEYIDHIEKNYGDLIDNTSLPGFITNILDDPDLLGLIQCSCPYEEQLNDSNLEKYSFIFALIMSEKLIAFNKPVLIFNELSADEFKRQGGEHVLLKRRQYYMGFNPDIQDCLGYYQQESVVSEPLQSTPPVFVSCLLGEKTESSKLSLSDYLDKRSLCMGYLQSTLHVAIFMRACIQAQPEKEGWDFYLPVKFVDMDKISEMLNGIDGLTTADIQYITKGNIDSELAKVRVFMDFEFTDQQYRELSALSNYMFAGSGDNSIIDALHSNVLPFIAGRPLVRMKFCVIEDVIKLCSSIKLDLLNKYFQLMGALCETDRVFAGFDKETFNYEKKTMPTDEIKEMVDEFAIFLQENKLNIQTELVIMRKYAHENLNFGNQIEIVFQKFFKLHPKHTGSTPLDSSQMADSLTLSVGELSGSSLAMHAPEKKPLKKSSEKQEFAGLRRGFLN